MHSIRAAIWLDADGQGNRGEAAEILALPEKYVGADAEVIAKSMTGTFEYEQRVTGVRCRTSMPFFRYFATLLRHSDAVWYLAQMRRWETDHRGQARCVVRGNRPDLYLQAARLLVKEGKAKASDFPWDSEPYYRAPQAGFIDGAVFDGHRPNDYLAQFAIGLQRIENGRLVTSGH